MKRLKRTLTKQLGGLTKVSPSRFRPRNSRRRYSRWITIHSGRSTGKDVAFLAHNLKTFMEAARKRPEIASMFTTFLPSVPQVFVEVDRDKVLKQGIDLAQVYQTLQTFMGGFFVNYFNRFGRTWQVYIEAEGDYRTDAKNVGQFFVRNANGDAVSLDAISTIQNISGPEFTLRYNEYRSAQINAARRTRLQLHTGDGRARRNVFAKPCRATWATTMLAMSFQEKKAQQGVSPTMVFGMSLIFVFPDSRGALRKLVAAVQRPAWHAHRGIRRIRNALVARNAKQHLRADRSNHAHRIGGEERDPHRRVRQRRIRKGQTAARRGARRRAPASTAHPDDIVCIHLRMPAAVVCQRLRRRRATRTRLHRHRRNDRRFGNRDFPYPGNVLRHRTIRRRAKTEIRRLQKSLNRKRNPSPRFRCEQLACEKALSRRAKVSPPPRQEQFGRYRVISSTIGRRQPTLLHRHRTAVYKLSSYPCHS